LLALLPGSRKQEVERMLGTMLSAASQFPDLQPVVAKAPSLPASLYHGFLRGWPSAKMVDGQAYDLLYHARAALVTSGTATLETALFRVPQVVCYKAGAVSYALAKRLVNKDLSYISIVNLIAAEQVVEELIQDDFTEGNCAAALAKLMDERHRQRIASGYRLVEGKLAGGHGAAQVAKDILTILSPS
jgi:lipid-A-disaccharide synthase